MRPGGQNEKTRPLLLLLILAKAAEIGLKGRQARHKGRRHAGAPALHEKGKRSSARLLKALWKLFLSKNAAEAGAVNGCGALETVV